MNKWTVLKSQFVLENRFFSVKQDTCQTPAGLKEYFYKTGRGAVLIFAVTSDKQVILEQQYRHPVKSICYDFPAGYVEENETTDQAARRELFEETGYTSEKFVDLGWAYSSPGNTEEKIFVYLALDVVQHSQPENPDTFEDIQIQLVPLAGIEKEVGRLINCALCIAAAFLALRYLNQDTV